MRAVFGLLAVVLAVNPAQIPEPLKEAPKSITPEAHELCIKGWEDWAAQNHWEVKKLRDEERHCLFVMYMQECGEWMTDRVKPGTRPAAGVPAFYGPVGWWDDEWSKRYQDRCFEFANDKLDDLSGTAKGETPRVLELRKTQRQHILPRLPPKRVLNSDTRVVPGAVREVSAQEAHRRTGTGTRP